MSMWLIGNAQPSCAFPSWDLICVLLCARVLSSVCSSMRALVCTLLSAPMCYHMCAIICVLSYGCTLLCALLCVLSYVLSSCSPHVCSHDTASFSQFHSSHCLGSLVGIIVFSPLVSWMQLALPGKKSHLFAKAGHNFAHIV